MTINERIKLLRKELGLNQTDFGEKIGIKVSQASYIEKAGNPVTQRVVQLICTVLTFLRNGLPKAKGICTPAMKRLFLTNWLVYMIYQSPR